jgi:hypothetical protein
VAFLQMRWIYSEKKTIAATLLFYPEKQLPSGVCVCAQPTVSLRQELFRDYPKRHSLQSSNQRISAGCLAAGKLSMYALLTAIFHASISLAINYDTRGARIPLRQRGAESER